MPYARGDVAVEKYKEMGGVKMAKLTISPEVVKIIRKSVDEAVKKAAEAIIKTNREFDAAQRNYFKETERLLYSLPALRLKVAQDEEDLKNGQMILKQRSKDVVTLSGAGGNHHDPENDYTITEGDKLAFMRQAIRDSAGSDNLPIVAHKENYRQWFVTMRMQDFVRMYALAADCNEIIDGVTEEIHTVTMTAEAWFAVYQEWRSSEELKKVEQ